MKILIGIDMTKLEGNLLMGDTLYNFCFIKIGRLLNEAEISAKPINDMNKTAKKMTPPRENAPETSSGYYNIKTLQQKLEQLRGKHKGYCVSTITQDSLITSNET